MHPHSVLKNPWFKRQFTSLALQPRVSLLSKCIKKLKPFSRFSGTISADVPTIQQKWVGRWLGTCAGMCVGAVVIGNIFVISEYYKYLNFPCDIYTYVF